MCLTACTPPSPNYMYTDLPLLSVEQSLRAIASWVAQMVKNLPATQETWVRSLGWEGPLEKGMDARSSILAWRIPWTEKPGRQRSLVGYCSESDTTNTFTFTLRLGSCWDQDSFQTTGSLTSLSPLLHLLVSWSSFFKKGMQMVRFLCPYISKDCLLF